MDKALETLVAETAHNLGYDAKLVPGKPFTLSDSYLGSKFRPDVLVKNGDRKAVVVVMGGFIGLGLVNLTDRSRKETGAGALICVPDPEFSKLSKTPRATPKSQTSGSARSRKLATFSRNCWISRSAYTCRRLNL